jgi:hypothetical protein
MKKGTFKTAVSLAIVGLGAWVLFFRKTHPYFKVGDILYRKDVGRVIDYSVYNLTCPNIIGLDIARDCQYTLLVGADGPNESINVGYVDSNFEKVV